MEGVVLAGVHAWGECVLESITCRPLFPVAGSPLIVHTLAWLRDGGIGTVSVCANSDTAALRRSLGDGEALHIQLHYYEDKMPRGPAGCARDAVAAKPPAAFLVVEGTVIPDLDVADLLAAHAASGCLMTVVVADGESSRKGCEMRPDRLEPLGIYVFSRAVLDHIPATGYQDIKESLIPRLYAQNLRVGTYVVRGCSTPRVTNAATYVAASKCAVERLTTRTEIPEGYVRLNGALIHETALLDGQARFVGPVLIGPNCRIEEDALIIGPTSVGEGCLIGRRAVVSRSVLWDQCQVGAGAILDHCILTHGAHIADEANVRETVCLARARKRTLKERLRSWFRLERAARRPVAYIPAARALLPLAGRRRGPARPESISRTDSKKPNPSPAASRAGKEIADGGSPGWSAPG